MPLQWRSHNIFLTSATSRNLWESPEIRSHKFGGKFSSAGPIFVLAYPKPDPAGLLGMLTTGPIMDTSVPATAQ